MRQIELQISESNGDSLGVLELENFKDFALTLTKAIGDINDFTKRKSTYSLDFDLPRTQVNNQILFGVANVNGVNESLKLVGRKNCRILVDKNQISYGFIRIYESKYKDSYKANFTGGNGDWVELLSNKYLNQLPWVSQLNSGTTTASETFSQLRIDAVNALDSDSVDIVYPYVIRDNISEGDVSALRPQLYVRSVIKRMFESIGYTTTGGFLDSDFIKGSTVGATVFKGVTIDPAFIFTNSNDVVQASRLEAITTTATFPIANNVGEAGGGAIRLVNKLSGYWDDEIQDTANAFDPVTSTYVAPNSGVFEMTLKYGAVVFEYDTFNNNNWLNYDINASNPSIKNPPQIALVMVANNISTSIIDGTIIAQSPLFLLPTDVTISGSVLAGDNITAWIQITDTASGFTSTFTVLNAPSLDKWRFWVGLDANLSIQPKSSIALGDVYGINSQLIENVSTLELLQDFKNQYNLYFTPNYISKTIAIETRDEFYQNIGSAENITEAVDLSKSIVINSDLTYKQQLSFQYATDSKDKFLEEWQKINNRTYGEYIHDFGPDYIQGKTTLKLKHIAPTIQKTMPVDNIVTSVIRREWEDVKEPLSINSDYKIRTFQIVQSQQFNVDGSARRVSSPLIVTVALMESFGNVQCFNDYKLTYNGVNGLFERYFAKTMANIEDKRQVDLFLKMPLYKFRTLDFSKPVYIDASISEIQGYYIIEEVKGYKLESLEPVKVRLLKFKNYQPVTVDPSQKTNINENTQNAQTPTFAPIQFVLNEGTPTETFVDVYDNDNSGNFLPLYFD
tara:strand:- start:5996 stop:8374 length:2379 start_codon:yes stop_codon:yes gene_type:complete